MTGRDKVLQREEIRISEEGKVLRGASRDMSGVQEGTACPSRNSPLAHLRLISLCQIMSSEAERVLPSSAALRAFLRYDFAVRSESNGCDKHSLPTPSSWGPFRVMPQSQPFVRGTNSLLTIQSWYCETTREGARPETSVRREVSARAADGFSAHREIGAQESAKARVRLGRTRRTSEQPIYQSAMKLKGAAGEPERDTQCSPGSPTCLFNLGTLVFFKYSSKRKTTI